MNSKGASKVKRCGCFFHVFYLIYIGNQLNNMHFQIWFLNHKTEQITLSKEIVQNSHNYVADEILKQFVLSEPKIVFVNDTNVPLMKEIAAQVKSIKVCHFFHLKTCCEALF